ncbi:unnamed protein product, partial [Ectocarpus sp. 13 AM-2016]
MKNKKKRRGRMGEGVLPMGEMIVAVVVRGKRAREESGAPTCQAEKARERVKGTISEGDRMPPIR